GPPPLPLSQRRQRPRRGRQPRRRQLLRPVRHQLRILTPRRRQDLPRAGGERPLGAASGVAVLRFRPGPRPGVHGPRAAVPLRRRPRRRGGGLSLALLVGCPSATRTGWGEQVRWWAC